MRSSENKQVSKQQSELELELILSLAIAVGMSGRGRTAKIEQTCAALLSASRNKNKWINLSYLILLLFKTKSEITRPNSR